MPEWLEISLVIAAWVVVFRWILPRFGVAT
jgi:hypothetical protein